MEKQYQVTGAAALITQSTAIGPAKMLLYAGHVLGLGYTQAEIDHNIAAGLLTEIGGDDDLIAGIEHGANPHVSRVRTSEEPVLAEGDAKVGEQVVDDSGNPPAAPETDAERDAAKAKLPADGSAPPKNAAQPVWVEYAVATGRDYDACKGETRDVLIALTTTK